MITGIARPTSAEVYVNDTAVHELNENRMTRWRGKNLGVVFQFFQLLPTISVIENIMLPMDFCCTHPMRACEKSVLELDKLTALYKASGIQITSAQTTTDFYESVTAVTDIIIYFMMLMAVLIALVGGLGLMGTMSIIVLERTREIGVMRAIGASNGDIQSIVIVEGLVIGLVSWALSILVSIPVTGVLTYGVGISMLGAPLPPVLDQRGMIIWLLFTVVLTLVSSALPARVLQD